MRLTVGTRCPFGGHIVTDAPPLASVTTAGVTPELFAAVEASPRRNFAAPVPTAPPAPSSGRGTLGALTPTGQGQHLPLPGVSDMREQSAVPCDRVRTPGSPTARTSDPITSHEAGWQVGEHADVFGAILGVLFEHGPQTDYHLSVLVARRLGLGAPMLRTSAGKRRHDLMVRGLVCDSTFKGRTDTGARAIRWTLTADGLNAVQVAA